MKKNLREEELFLILISFWLTVIIERSVIFYFIRKYSVVPGLVINGIHIHHYLTGLGLILACGLIYFLSGLKKTFFHFLFLGIGIALMADELSIWFDTKGNYWAIENFLAVSFTGIFLLILYILSKKQRKLEIKPNKYFHQNPKNPYISVVIPAFNEEKLLPQTLKSLLRQNFNDFEIIVVDNNSNDRTSEIARKVGARVIKEKRQGVVFARQKGFMAAKGEIIATTDADTVLPFDWLLKIAQNFRKNKKLVLYGGLCNLYSGPITAKFSAYYLLYPYRYLDKFISGGWSLSGSNLAVRKEAFLKIGGFDTKLKSYEDVDISQRLKKIGQSKLDPCLKVETSGRRFRHSLLYGISPWVVNEVIRIFKIKQEFVSQPNIRVEKSLLNRILSFFPIFSVIIFLFALFYLSNPLISESKRIKIIKEKTSILASKIQNKKELKNYLMKIKNKSLERFLENK